MHQSKIETLTSLLEHFITSDGPSGCGLQIVHNDKTVYSNCIGVADIENQEPITTDTLFRMHSLTKIVTVTLALMYFERGCFLMDDPVSDYLPAYAHLKVAHNGSDGTSRITDAKNILRVKHLFNMTAGISYPGESDLSERETTRVIQMLEKREHSGQMVSTRDFADALAQVPLAFEPGTRWRYSFAIDVLGAMIEVWSGKTLGQAMFDEIFEPLNMTNTCFRLSQDKKRFLSNIYRRNDDGSMTQITDMDDDYQPQNAVESGGGGLLSTMSDFSRFAQMLANNGQYKDHHFISRKTLDMMATNTLDASLMKDFDWEYLKGYGYGFGVRTLIDKSVGLNGTIGEFGWSGLAGTWVLIDREEKLSAVYVQQMLPNKEAYHQPRLRAAIYGAI